MNITEYKIRKLLHKILLLRKYWFRVLKSRLWGFYFVQGKRWAYYKITNQLKVNNYINFHNYVNIAGRFLKNFNYSVSHLENFPYSFATLELSKTELCNWLGRFTSLQIFARSQINYNPNIWTTLSLNLLDFWSNTSLGK